MRTDFYVTDQLLIRYSVIMIYVRKYECIGTVHQLFIDLKIQLGEILYNIWVRYAYATNGYG